MCIKSNSYRNHYRNIIRLCALGIGIRIYIVYYTYTQGKLYIDILIIFLYVTLEVNEDLQHRKR